MKIEKRINIEVVEITEGKMTWAEAMKYAKEKGMRLPTRIEALAMVEAGIKFSFAWTCEKAAFYSAWCLGDNGIFAATRITETLYVVLIADNN